VLDNAILPLEIQGSEKQAARQEARPLLPRFGLQGFADAYPSALSGGMRQRAALLRTIMSQRELLLLDEPFGALDALTRFELQDWMLELWADLDKTILFITHDVEEALYLGDEVIVLSPRPGTIEQIMRVDLPRPRRRGMIAEPSFGRQATALLETLGARI
jgi:ABC-type nitrate/sulfonate/bicarbonate transport system ATPase subunit